MRLLEKNMPKKLTSQRNSIQAVRYVIWAVPVGHHNYQFQASLLGNTAHLQEVI